MRVAAVDVGTNSVRLLVAEPGGGGLRSIDRRMQITRLGRGVDAAGHLDDDALALTLGVLADYAEAWRAHGVPDDQVRITATSAVRDAADRDRFFGGVRARAGIDAEVLSGEQEAHLSFRGATGALAGDPPWVVLDIGGGSTEVIRGTAAPEASTSRQMGCVRLAERFLRSDPATAEQLASAVSAIDAELDEVDRLVAPSHGRTLVGVAGTVTTVAALHLGLDRYDAERIHGTRVPVAAVAATTARLAAMTVAQRAALGPMAPGREDVIVAGALVLQRVLERFGFGEVLASESDILDGIAWSVVERR